MMGITMMMFLVFYLSIIRSFFPWLEAHFSVLQKYIHYFQRLPVLHSNTAFTVLNVLAMFCLASLVAALLSE